MLQILVYGLLAASVYAPVALSWGIIYRVSGFFHFTHAAVFTVGAYTAFAAYRLLGVSLPCAILFSCTAAAMLGWLLEMALYRPLRRMGASSDTLLLASLGAYLTLQNGLALIFGDEPRHLRSGDPLEGIPILGVRLTPVQITIVIAGTFTCVSVWLFLTRTRSGLTIRAVANDVGLAMAFGVNINHVTTTVFAACSAVAGLAGMLAALDTAIVPTMGLPVLMTGIVAVIIGGVDSFAGSLLGALALAVAEKTTVMAISSQWQDSIVFVMLLVFLAFRPQGLLGNRQRKAAI
jgi:branched-chain amino acid transport system permease protein